MKVFEHSSRMVCMMVCRMVCRMVCGILFRGMQEVSGAEGAGVF